MFSHFVFQTMMPATMASLEDFFDANDIAEWLHGDEVKQAKIALATEAVAYWQDIAPVESGEYRDSIHVAEYGDEVYAQADDPKAGIIEYGTEDTPEFACRARTEAYFNRIVE
jgi:hypothetical protein